MLLSIFLLPGLILLLHLRNHQYFHCCQLNLAILPAQYHLMILIFIIIVVSFHLLIDFIIGGYLCIIESTFSWNKGYLQYLFLLIKYFHNICELIFIYNMDKWPVFLITLQDKPSEIYGNKSSSYIYQYFQMVVNIPKWKIIIIIFIKKLLINKIINCSKEEHE